MRGESRWRREGAGAWVLRDAALAMFAAAVMLACACAGRAAAARVGNGRVAVQVSAAHTPFIKTITPAGSDTGKPLLTAMPGVPRNSGDPVWSANGMLLLFVSPLAGLSQIWAINAAGQARERLTHGNVPATAPAWSPNDTAVVFCRVHKHVSNIYVLQLIPHRRLVRLTHRHEVDLQPRWSPDGKAIVFASNRTGSFQIFAMNADGRDQRQLTHQQGPSTDPTWAPGGMQIAYTNRLDGVNNVYAMRWPGGASRQVTTLGGTHPSWSPDGKLIAFTRPGGVWSVLASGEAAAAPATLLAATGTAPSWGPLLNAVGAVAQGTATVKLPTGQTILIGTPPPAPPGGGTSPAGAGGGGGASGGGGPTPAPTQSTTGQPSVLNATAGGVITPPKPAPATTGPSVSGTGQTGGTTSNGSGTTSGAGSSSGGTGSTSGGGGSNTTTTTTPQATPSPSGAPSTGTATVPVLPAAPLPVDTVVAAPDTSIQVTFKPQAEPLTAPPSTALVSHGTFTIASRTPSLLSLNLRPPARCRAARTASPNREGEATVHVRHGHTGVRTRQIFADSHLTTWTLTYSCQGTKVKVTAGLVFVTLLHGHHRLVKVPRGHSFFAKA